MDGWLSGRVSGWLAGWMGGWVKADAEVILYCTYGKNMFLCFNFHSIYCRKPYSTNLLHILVKKKHVVWFTPITTRILPTRCTATPPLCTGGTYCVHFRKMLINGLHLFFYISSKNHQDSSWTKTYFGINKNY